MTPGDFCAGLGLQAALGLLIAYAGSRAIVRLMFPLARNLPVTPSLDAPVLAFAAGVAMLTALAIGLMPAVRATRPTLTLADTRTLGHRRRYRVEATLVTTPLALSLALLVWAGLFATSLHGLLARPTVRAGSWARPAFPSGS